MFDLVIHTVNEFPAKILILAHFISMDQCEIAATQMTNIVNQVGAHAGFFCIEK